MVSRSAGYHDIMQRISTMKDVIQFNSAGMSEIELAIVSDDLQDLSEMTTGIVSHRIGSNLNYVGE